jgi:FdhD protein
MNSEAARPGRTVETDVTRFDTSGKARGFDAVVTEEPLEIRLTAGDQTRQLAVTMRTPGADFELAAGFVFSESIVRERNEIDEISYCVDPAIDPEQRYNIVNVALRTNRLPELTRFERHFVMNSSCGVCGKAGLDALRELGVAPVASRQSFALDTLLAMPERMRAAQRVFAATGGLHAAALFDASGELLAVREDIGRHNAVDKLAGWALMDGRMPLHDLGLLVSGRASYEILQKAVVARIALVAAVSAPSSLAVELARAFNVTLLGFVRDGRANAYAAPERISR